MRKLVLWLFSGLVLQACTVDSDPGMDALVQVDLDRGRPMAFAALYDTIVYIPLETKHSSLLNEFSDVLIFDSLLAVIDMPFGPARRVSLFDRSGKFLHSLYHPDEGPGRFLKVESVWHDVQTGRVKLLDALGKQVLLFDEAGNFLEAQSLPASFSHFVQAGPAQYWLHASNEPIVPLGRWGNTGDCLSDSSETHADNLWYLDAAACQLSSHVPIRSSLVGETMTFRPFSQQTSDGYFYYFVWFDPTVYRLGPSGQVEEAFTLDFGANQFVPEDEARFSALSNPVERMRYINQLQHEKVYRLLDVGATQRHWWAVFWCRQKGWLLRISKEGHEVTLYHSPPAFTPNDFDLIPLPSRLFTLWRNYHVWVIPAHRLAEVLAEGARALPEATPVQAARFERARSVLSSVHRDDNPILVFARLSE